MLGEGGVPCRILCQKTISAITSLLCIGFKSHSFLFLTFRLCKRSKNCTGLEKEDGWWWKDQPVVIVLQWLKTLKKKADTNQLHCLGGGWQWNIIPKHHWLSHHYCILQGLWAKKPKAYPKLSQATQEVASVRGLSLVKYSILTICCCSVVVRSSLNHSRQDKGSFSKKTTFIDNNITTPSWRRAHTYFIHNTLQT